MATSVETYGLTRKRVWVMALLTVVTYGIYVPYWFLSRRQVFDALSSEQKLWKNVLVLWLAWYILDAVLLIIFFAQPDLTAWETIDPIIDLLNGVAGIVEVVSSFRVRRILLNHLTAVRSPEGGLSWAATFFFGFLYLQYKINRLTPENPPQNQFLVR